MPRSRDEERVYRQRRRTELRRLRERGEMPEDAHGASGYTEWGCRCDRCRTAHNDRVRDSVRRHTARMRS